MRQGDQAEHHVILCIIVGVDHRSPRSAVAAGTARELLHARGENFFMASSRADGPDGRLSSRTAYPSAPAGGAHARHRSPTRHSRSHTPGGAERGKEPAPAEQADRVGVAAGRLRSGHVQGT